MENTRSTGSPFVDKGTLTAFLEDPLLKKLRNYQLEQKPATNNNGAVNRTLSFKRATI
jgi:hypothetical protein